MQPALEAIAIVGCKYSCEMLKSYWHGPADVFVPSPDALNPAAVYMHKFTEWDRQEATLTNSLCDR